MSRLANRLTAAAVASLLVAGTAGAAVAEDGGSGGSHGPRPTTTLPPSGGGHEVTSKGGPTTTEAPEPTDAPEETDPPETTSTTSAGGRGTPVLPFIDGLIAKVAGSSIDAATRDALVQRLRDARAAFVAGRAVSSPVMQKLISDVYAALRGGAAPTGDDAGKHGTGSGHDGQTGQGGGGTETTDSTLPDGGKLGADQGDDQGDDHGAAGDHRMGGPTSGPALSVLLDSAAAKVNASSLPDADKASLLAAIDQLRAKVKAGTPVTESDVKSLLAALRTALAGQRTIEAPEATDPSEVDDSPSPRERAVHALDAEIAKVQSSDLPDDVKAKIVAALSAAKDTVTTASDVADAVRQQIADRRAKRLDELVSALASAADHVSAFIEEVATHPGTEDAVTEARAKVESARSALALASSAADLRGVWLTLRQAHLVCVHALHPEQDTTTTVPATDPAPTTVAPA